MIGRLALAACVALIAAPALAQGAGGDSDTFPYEVEPVMTAGETPPPLDMVMRMFAAAYPEQCGWALGGARNEPDVYELSFRYASDDPEQPDRAMRLYRFECSSGAYNVQHAYMAWDSDVGMRSLSFAQPAFRIQYEQLDNTDGPVRGIEVTGVSAAATLTNSEFDPATLTITSHSCWRGICDASSHGVWVQDGPDFRLVTYDIDGSYDGEENPLRVIDYSTAVSVLP